MALDAGQNPLTRQLPKTGQTTSYQSGDDGTYEAGWWKGRLIATNRIRFLAKTIGGDDIVLDRATGLMWAADGNAAGCNGGAAINWVNAIVYAGGLVFAGFSDWRVPNVTELFSITNLGLFNPAIDEPPFSNTSIDSYWSSTTYEVTTTKAFTVFSYDGDIVLPLKTSDECLRCVRGGL